jgi:hypothetical protein
MALSALTAHASPLLCSADGTSSICSILTRDITTRLVRSYRCTRTRRCRVPSRLSVVCWQCQFWADFTTVTSERKFSTETGGFPPQSGPNYCTAI